MYGKKREAESVHASRKLRQALLPQLRLKNRLDRRLKQWFGLSHGRRVNKRFSKSGTCCKYWRVLGCVLCFCASHCRSQTHYVLNIWLLHCANAWNRWFSEWNCFTYLCLLCAAHSSEVERCRLLLTHFITQFENCSIKEIYNNNSRFIFI